MILNWDDRDWSWNPIDQNLLLINDRTYDLKNIYHLFKNKRRVIQAGGAMGVVPYFLAKTFENVHSFEASPFNYPHAKENLSDIDNVVLKHQALSNQRGKCTINLHWKQVKNAGCYYTKNDSKGDIETVTIDEEFKNFDDIDFIMLDVEGNELKVLEGAIKTIKRCLPIIMIEDVLMFQHQDIKQQLGAPEKLLRSLGYKRCGKMYKDLVFINNSI
jgi:FkbM family methyltransferase